MVAKTYNSKFLPIRILVFFVSNETKSHLHMNTFNFIINNKEYPIGL